MDIKKDLPKRKATRLKYFDYSSTGVYFVTLCTQNRRRILSRIVGTGVPDGPHIELLPYGKIVDKYINQLNEFYDHITIENYVIMPNHVHLLLFIKRREDGPSRTPDMGGPSRTPDMDGPSRTPVPTVQNSDLSRFVSTLKRFCNKECEENIWQYRSYDHVIRNQKDYEEHFKYIYENPIRWQYDTLYEE